MDLGGILDLIQEFGLPLLFGIIYFVSQFFNRGKKGEEKQEENSPQPTFTDELQEKTQEAQERWNRYLNRNKDSSSTKNTSRRNVEANPLDSNVIKESMDSYDSLQSAEKNIRANRPSLGTHPLSTLHSTKPTKLKAEKFLRSESPLRPNFKNGSLKQAIVLSEVLGPPVSINKNHLERIHL